MGTRKKGGIKKHVHLNLQRGGPDVTVHKRRVKPSKMIIEVKIKKTIAKGKTWKST